ncbi:hypothetical protein P3X46_008723 [Hevea brasiliensis]|uniref:RRM domain-containing protein n=1 Tax=Hevea brasiliensis TaxID=3981 RepID=A0ABQ9MK22_HEVBR|nr:protein vip1 [Hevea brasiliensis]KAJ9180491.1 hypothetical protein P3X46_008723 [Hevea brasiliensis]
MDQLRQHLVKMGRLDLTVKVLNLSPKVTVAELNSFFSYCGTVEKIQLQKNKDQLRALVTFRQPYAFQTALLLNDAVLPSGQKISIPDPDLITETENREGSESIPAFQAAAIESMASKGVGMLKKTKDELEENLKLSEKGKVAVGRTRTAVNVAGQTIERIGRTIKSNDIISTAALWISDALDKASKSVSTLASGKTNNPNSRKLK